ncbi:2250_t:CDS:1 [Funneliformis geosporum]|uniref:14011_t:CDS:1 n=1 Tax=Funneliformis geosporum TaxID=1117311 RepID=A0A9W4SP81_9GLOM|nr:2250_t:CDS:1 [Funneliformis geosporum]CAI2176589.1 14011_t:CDS:1 [Funneliformis geosporum]
MKNPILTRAIQKLIDSNSLLTTIESCTGGLIAHLITDVPGTSSVFWGGRVVYNNSTKIALGVSPELLQTFGAVSREVALSLAKNGLLEMQKFSNNDNRLICIATTGLADPREENYRKLGGLCWVGIASTAHPPFAVLVEASPLSREKTKLEFAMKALELIVKSLEFNDVNSDNFEVAKI